MTINLLGETTWPGEVRVGGRLLGVDNRSFGSAYVVFRDERCLATADCVSVWFDRRSRRFTTLLPEIRQTMEAELRRAPPRPDRHAETDDPRPHGPNHENPIEDRA